MNDHQNKQDDNNNSSDSSSDEIYSRNFIKISDFSIDHILNRAGNNKYNGTNNSNYLNEIEYCDRLDFNTINYHNNEHFNESNCGIPPILNWLQYTRYRPPKLQRPFRNGPLKRTPGRLPRVPFTPTQLNALEDSYKSSNYLSSEMANKLAIQLNLTNTRIKIWFQNRRARERREKRERGESPDLLIPPLLTQSQTCFDEKDTISN